MVTYADPHSGQRQWRRGKTRGYSPSKLEQDARRIFYRDFRVQQRYGLADWGSEYVKTKGGVYKRKRFR